MIKNFNNLIQKVKEVEKSTVCVAASDDEEVLKAVKIATDIGFIDSILVGDKEKIEAIIKNIGLRDYKIVNKESSEEATLEAVKIVKSGKANVCLLYTSRCV